VPRLTIVTFQLATSLLVLCDVTYFLILLSFMFSFVEFDQSVVGEFFAYLGTTSKHHSIMGSI